MTETKDLIFDSGKRSILSMLLDRKPVEKPYGGWYYAVIWVISTAVCYGLPLVICALTQPSLLLRDANLEMPFLLDLAAYPMNLVVIPLLLINVVRERRILNKTLVQYLNGPAIGGDRYAIHDTFEAFYRRYNLPSSILAALVAIAFTYLWSNKFLSDHYITWHSFGTLPGSERLNLAGYYSAFVMVGFYWFLLVFTALRGILHFCLFWSISKVSGKDIVVIPIHPDGCGGLAMISQVVQLYRILASSVGLTIASIYANDVFILNKSPLDVLNILMIFGFIIFCFIAFFLPLWPFSSQMRESKRRTLETISDLFQTLWRSEIRKANKVDYSKVDYDALEHVSALYHMADQMPIWPYDLKTVRSFMSYVIVPLIGIVVTAIVSKIIG
jgi:hypothetical protein